MPGAMQRSQRPLRQRAYPKMPRATRERSRARVPLGKMRTTRTHADPNGNGYQDGPDFHATRRAAGHRYQRGQKRKGRSQNQTPAYAGCMPRDSSYPD